jgi:argininosuccinate synthase
MAVSRDSTSSLYDQDLSSMDLEGGFNQQDSEGFIRINAIRLMAHHAIMRRKHLYWGAEPEEDSAAGGASGS